MKIPAVLEHALELAGLVRDVEQVQPLHGGCIHQVLRVTLADNRRVVAKINRADMLAVFEEEAAGLRALTATETVIAPLPLAVCAHSGQAALLMTVVDSLNEHDERVDRHQTWRNFGCDLAALHAADVGDRYGFDHDNHIGSTRQPNAWMSDWVEFNATNRLGFQLKTARDAGLLLPEEVRTIESVINRFDQFISRAPKPSLLHGDLWSGNVIPTVDLRASHARATAAVIDPACSIGDALADIAMMQLFGGFPHECFEAYEQASSVSASTTVKTHKASEGSDPPQTRIGVYQLYHLLNHVNIFGRGYASQAMSLARQLLAA